MIDLHTHSQASDGQLAPDELVRYAKAHGVSVMALTDHDTISGIPLAAQAAKEEHITFVPGIELNIQWPTGEFHLLGLGIQRESAKLNEIIARLQSGRQERNELIAQKFRELGIGVTVEQLEAAFPGAVIGRPHFADFLVQQKIVKTRQQAFDKYLGKGRPAYAPHAGADLDAAIAAILDAGAVPVLAHPMSLYISWGKLEPVLQNLHERGIQGLEAWHPGVRKGEAVRLEALGRKLGFFITGGSDFHGERVRADRHIGHTAGQIKVEDRFWTEELRPHLPQFCR